MNNTNPLYFTPLKRFLAKLPSGASIVYFTVIVVLAISFGSMGAGILWFTQNYYVQNPVQVKIRCMACQRPTPTPQVIVVTPTATPKKVVPTPTPEEPEYINKRPTDEFVASLVRSYPWDYSTAIRLAKSENYYNLTKSFDCARSHTNNDGSVDVGLFQINSIHATRLATLGMTMEDMKDCRKNADYAYNWVYKHSGWQPWSAYINGSYLSHSEI